MNNPMKIFDTAVLAGIVLFVGVAASWYLAVPMGLAGIYFVFAKKGATSRASGSRRPTQVVDDLDDPNGSISIANSYHHVLSDE